MIAGVTTTGDLTSAPPNKTTQKKNSIHRHCGKPAGSRPEFSPPALVAGRGADQSRQTPLRSTQSREGIPDGGPPHTQSAGAAARRRFRSAGNPTAGDALVQAAPE
ncbi:eukaryotic translation initiation factor 3subunit L [Striga asiatica]|uniref:Eukaryotic translation initiation factor 3subunit L n=1 Tax=Striga asiatica TaxID=4170 RepID=A0A5A7PWC9_STRAF|nr:eukaryotic translation initiation factor 3subunit L [Striga asiatica]